MPLQGLYNINIHSLTHKEGILFRGMASTKLTSRVIQFNSVIELREYEREASFILSFYLERNEVA